MTQPSGIHDTAPIAHCARDLDAVCAQPGPGCAPGAPNPSLTQCIILSHCFGTLFMNNVHEYYSRGFQKNNNNKIK